ncbi:ribonuclease [Sphingomonas arantia]|uniref:Ribonuclease n=1 Tax=Sphingomonas arantia TaxID=1460676 RepID=A0ABW4U3C1_9SPHN
MAKWLYEAGIGEARAALVEGGVIVEARVAREGGLRAGSVRRARLARITAPGRRGLATFDDGEAVLEPLPPGVAEGGRLLIQIVREAIPEAGRPKPARARAAAEGAEIGDGPDLAAQLAAGDIPFRAVATGMAGHGPDLLEAAGWSELIEEATGGAIDFAGGALRLSVTPAMTLFDIDGVLPPAALALAGAQAAARAIQRMEIGGSIGIDLPTVSDKAVRQAVAAAVDAILPQPYERTAVNGFGFLQIVRRRVRASLPELLAADPVLTAALGLLRQAERAAGIGTRTLVAAPAVIARIAERPDWTEALARRTGTAVALRADAARAISQGYVQTDHPPPRT